MTKTKQVDVVKLLNKLMPVPAYQLVESLMDTEDESKDILRNRVANLATLLLYAVGKANEFVQEPKCPTKL